jgi:hypothetical protein
VGVRGEVGKMFESAKIRENAKQIRAEFTKNKKSYRGYFCN